jgi:hypothetical protein
MLISTAEIKNVALTQCNGSVPISCWIPSMHLPAELQKEVMTLLTVQARFVNHLFSSAQTPANDDNDD